MFFSIFGVGRAVGQRVTLKHGRWLIVMCGTNEIKLQVEGNFLNQINTPVEKFVETIKKTAALLKYFFKK